MPKPDPRADLEQLLSRRWLQRLPLEPERLGRPPDQGCVPNRVRRRQEHQSSGRVGQRSDAPAVLLVDPIHDVAGVGEGKPSASCAGSTLRDSSSRASGFPRVSPTIRSRTRSSSLPGTTASAARRRVTVRQTWVSDISGRPTSSRSSVRFVNGEHQRHGLGEQPSRDEPEDLARGGVEPLHVVHETQQRLLLGNLGQQAQRRQRDKEAIRRIVGREAEGSAQGGLLGVRQRVEASEHWPAQLVQTSERQFHLGFDAGDLADSKTSGLLARISQKRGLARSRLGPDDQHPAAATTDVLEQPVKLFTLAGTARNLGARSTAIRPQA